MRKVTVVATARGGANVLITSDYSRGVSSLGLQSMDEARGLVQALQEVLTGASRAEREVPE